uniref:Serpentine receptor class gamma n=1 Tax=Parastrongyloides trichosuri TaxID=131310 RepID=A0A0N5A145_PARTI
MLAETTKGIILTILLSLLAIIDIISYCIYLTLLIFLIKKFFKDGKNISKGFYVLFIFNGILDLIFITEEYISFRIPQFGAFKHFYQETFSSTIFSGMCYTYALCQNTYIAFSGITISFNRLYTIKFPLKYTHFWKGWKLLILVIWPFFIIIPIFIIFCTSQVNYEEDEIGRLSAVYVDPHISTFLWMTTIYLHCASFISNGILNIILIYTLKTSFKYKSNIDKSFKMDVTMTKYAIIYFLIFSFALSIEIIETILLTFEEYALANDFLTLTTLCQTLIVFFPPYGLLFLSKDIRRSFFKHFGIRKFLNILGFNNVSSVTEIKKVTTPINNINFKRKGQLII